MTTIDDILYRVYENPLLRNVRKSDVVGYVQSLTKLLNIRATMVEKAIHLQIKNFRAPLPLDLHQVLGVTEIKEGSLTAGVRLTRSSDARIQQHRELEGSYPSTVTYKEVPGWIYTDFDEGKIEVIYKAFDTDSNGFPVLPDNESLLMAIENFIKFRYFTILFETGHVSENVLNRAEQQYMWYVGQASNSFDTPSEEETETIFNALIRLIPDRDSFFNNYKYSSNTEKLKLHD